MTKPLISVIVPIYNAAPYLAECVESLLSVTYESLEIILVDDGSTDGSGELCDAISDTRVRVIHKKNGGVSSARNAGLDAARGEWLAFADADDLVLPDIYSYLISGADKHSADVVQCAAYYEEGDLREIIYTDGKPCYAASPANMNRRFFALLANSNWCKIYRASAARGVRFDPAYTIGEDLRYNLDVLARARGTLLLPEPKYRYIQRDGSACRSALSERRLSSFRDMIIRAECDFAAYPKIRKFLLAERMLTSTDTLSKITLAGDGDFAELAEEIKADVRRSLPRALISPHLPIKEKLKLMLIAVLPHTYERLLKRSKSQ